MLERVPRSSQVGPSTHQRRSAPKGMQPRPGHRRRHPEPVFKQDGTGHRPAQEAWMSAPDEQSPDQWEDKHWRRNLAVCLVGSFTTIVAMTLMLPFLPLYVEELGVSDRAAIAQWSGIAYGATFFAAALVAPIWGRLGDIYGRKLTLVRASLGMTVAIGLMGMAGDVYQLVALRLFVGLAGGYSSGSMVLVATQTPKHRSAWALGVLSSGIMAGNLVGPLIGGALPPIIGIRNTFLAAGGMIFLAFLATALLIKENKSAERKKAAKASGGWRHLPH